MSIKQYFDFASRSLPVRFLGALLLGAALVTAIGLYATYQVTQSHIQNQLVERSKLLASVINHSAMIAHSDAELQHVIQEVLNDNPDIRTISVMLKNNQKVIASAKADHRAFSKTEHEWQELLDTIGAGNFGFHVEPDQNLVLIAPLWHALPAANMAGEAGGQASAQSLRNPMHNMHHTIGGTPPVQGNNSGLSHRADNAKSGWITQNLSASDYRGGILLRVDRSGVIAAMSNVLWRLMPVSAIGVLAILVLTYLLLHYQVIAPIGGIGHVMKRQQSGDRQARAKTQVTQELDEVATTFNGMIEAISWRDTQFQNLVEGSIQGVYIHQDWKLLFVNPAMADIFGYDNSEDILALGNVWPLLSPDERERLWGYKMARQKGEFAPDVYEARGVKKNGSTIWAEFRITSIDWHGTSAMQCVVVDITERRRAEENLQNQIERFNTALDNMSQGLCMFDGEQRLIVANERYASMYGISSELVKPGTTFRQILEHRIANEVYAGQVHEDYIQERLSAVLERDPSTKVQELSDGRFVAISHCPMSNGGWLATHEDVTEKTRTEATSLRLSRIVEDSINEVFVFDAETLKFLEVNASACRNTGYTAEELAGMTPVDLKPEFTLEQFEDAIAPLRRGEQDHFRFQTIHRRKDGSYYDADIALQQIKSRDRPVFAAIIEDITERKKAEDELARHRDHLQELVDAATKEIKANAVELELALSKEQELNKLQREFVSMASHEFRTPLAIIDATAQRMKSRADKNQLTPEDAVQRVEKIRAAVGRMTRLMESTLDAARMDEGILNIEIGECDLRYVLIEVLTNQIELSPSHNITCDLRDLPDGIQGDSEALNLVFTNLLSNAVKYTPDAPDIEVIARAEGDHVVIQVRDHGVGIDEDELDRIGERFFRARTSTGTAGTGIGLNLVKTLVEIHGGTVSIESKKGEGSTFIIRLPIDGPDQTEQADTKVA